MQKKRGGYLAWLDGDSKLAPRYKIMISDKVMTMWNLNSISETINSGPRFCFSNYSSLWPGFTESSLSRHKLSLHSMWWCRPLVVKSSNTNHHSEDQLEIEEFPPCKQFVLTAIPGEPVREWPKQDRKEKSGPVWSRTKSCGGKP